MKYTCAASGLPTREEEEIDVCGRGREDQPTKLPWLTDPPSKEEPLLVVGARKLYQMVFPFLVVDVNFLPSLANDLYFLPFSRQQPIDSVRISYVHSFEK